MEVVCYQYLLNPLAALCDIPFVFIVITNIFNLPTAQGFCIPWRAATAFKLLLGMLLKITRKCPCSQTQEKVPNLSKIVFFNDMART